MNIPSRFCFCIISSTSFLVTDCRASFSLFSVIWGRAVSKYWNNWFVGLWVERVSNFKQSFLGTPNFIAKLYQFPKTSDVASRTRAILSKRPTRGEGAFGDVITSRTLSSSAQPAVEEINHVLPKRILGQNTHEGRTRIIMCTKLANALFSF